MRAKGIGGKTVYKRPVMSTTASASSKPIEWYRTPLDKADFRSLHERSDFLGWCQTLGYLGVLVLTGERRVVLRRGILSGTSPCCWFSCMGQCLRLINAVHELGHGTVFKTKALNPFFERVFAIFSGGSTLSSSMSSFSRPASPLYAASAG